MARQHKRGSFTFDSEARKTAHPQQQHKASRGSCGWAARCSLSDKANKTLNWGRPPVATFPPRQRERGGRPQGQEPGQGWSWRSQGSWPFVGARSSSLGGENLPRSGVSIRALRAPGGRKFVRTSLAAQPSLRTQPTVAALTNVVTISPVCIVQPHGSVTNSASSAGLRSGRHSARRDHSPPSVLLSLHGQDGR